MQSVLKVRLIDQKHRDKKNSICRQHKSGGSMKAKIPENVTTRAA